MKTQTNVGAWIGTLVMGVVAFGVLTVEEGDMLMRAVATAATAIIGAALIVAEAWQRRTAPPVVNRLEAVLQEGREEGTSNVEEILRTFPTRDLVQALTQRVGVERRNLPIEESEDGPAILLKIVD